MHFRLVPRSRTLPLVSMSVCLSIRTSVRPRNAFLVWTKFGMYLEVDEWYTKVCRLTRSKVKVKVTEVWSVRKWPISKVFSSVNMHVIRLTVNFMILKMISKYEPDRFFFIFILVRRHVTFKLRVFHLWQTNFASYKESTGSHVWGLFCVSAPPHGVCIYSRTADGWFLQ